ncbi:hypothetical protein [Actinocrispum sp. NPDC049592]|uniref:hypothetical protein n=1 Tax=Actinocrispum sp. NPDC049592 TaxID=3154835 RepID=UPI00342520DC
MSTPSYSPAEPQPIPVPPTAVPKPRTWSWLSCAIGAVAGAAVIGGIWGVTSLTGGDNKESIKPGTFILRGTFQLTDGVTSSGTGCAGYRGYNDIAEGAGVTVYNAAGAVVATGELGDSTYNGSVCTFKLVIVNVPDGEKFYQVEVTHRGKISVPEADAKAGLVALTLGNK